MPRHLLFYDGQCGLCDQAVQIVLRADHSRSFLFAPLQGETAQAKLKELPSALKNIDSLILIENYGNSKEKILVLGKGALRVCWLLGGAWKLLGWISFLPSFLYDWAYRLVAKNRHRLFQQNQCVLPDPSQKDRFLK